MLINLGKKYELVAAAPDIYGRVYYFVSNGDVMSPKSYPKIVAEMVCAAWNGDDSKFYDVAETLDKLEQRLKKTQFIKRQNVIEILAACGAYDAAMQSLQRQGNKEAYSRLLAYKEEVLDTRGFVDDWVKQIKPMDSRE